MRLILYVLLLGFVHTAYAAIPSDGNGIPKCVVRDYGVAKTSTDYIRRFEPATTSGAVRSYSDIAIVHTTNSITAEKGVRFGIAHEFLNIQPLDRIDVVVTHPRINKPDGTKSTGFTVQLKPSNRYTLYGLDEDYEVVRGEWKFQFFFKGTLLCEQAFHVE